MNTRISYMVVAATLALWSATAPAELKNVENAYESDAGHVMLPGNAGGQVTVRECAICKPVSLRVNNGTLYYIGSASSQPVSLDALRKAATANGASGRLLTVFYSLESNVVTRIVLGAG